MGGFGRFSRAFPLYALRGLLARTGGLPYLPRWLVVGLVVGPVAGLAALAARELVELMTAGLAVVAAVVVVGDTTLFRSQLDGPAEPSRS